MPGPPGPPAERQQRGSREVRMRVRFLSVAYFGRGTLPLKKGYKGTTGGHRMGSRMLHMSVLWQVGSCVLEPLPAKGLLKTKAGFLMLPFEKKAQGGPFRTVRPPTTASVALGQAWANPVLLLARSSSKNVRIGVPFFCSLFW